MALSKNTLDHLLEAESHLRAAVKSAAVKKNLVVKQLADLLHGMEQCKSLMKSDMIDNRDPGSSGMFGSFFNDDEE